MSAIAANGIQLEYEVAGDPAHPPMLLIMGLGMQLIGWDDEFIDLLAAEGFYVIRFDNRDIGLSTWFDEAGVPDLATALGSGVIPPAPYTLSDMANDAAGLLTALGFEKAHIVGVSMGGMIAQTFAVEHPGQTLSLCSIMSTNGNPLVGAPHAGVVEQMFFAPAPTTRDEAIEMGVQTWKLIGSPGFNFDEDRTRRRAGEFFDRSNHPGGLMRQLLAIVNQPDRTAALGGVTCPTLVIHGDADPLVDLSGGKATAAAIPGAEFWVVEGMGHDLPVEMQPTYAARIGANARRAS